MSGTTNTSVSSSTEKGDGEGKTAAILIEGLKLTYSDGTEAVKDVTMEVPQGEFFGFLGPNGAGKTTTIKVLVTLLQPTGGRVEVNGFDVKSKAQEVRESIGYMPQETSVDEELTARENIRFACRAYGVPRERRAERIDELLELVDLADVGDKKSGGFSGGMKKRLDAAMALVHRPSLVFLDEPTTGLDPKARNELWDYFERINERGTTVLLTTQYLEEADHLCERLAVIRDGGIVARGSPSELKRRVGVEFLDVDVEGGRDTAREAAEVLRGEGIFGGDASVEVTDRGLSITANDARSRGSRLMVALDDAGIQVTGFDVREPTLDDVFLAVTDDETDVSGGEDAGSRQGGSE
jgi:ABC-2 type transport system ATP-binding protein